MRHHRFVQSAPFFVLIAIPLQERRRLLISAVSRRNTQNLIQLHHEHTTRRAIKRRRRVCRQRKSRPTDCVFRIVLKAQRQRERAEVRQRRSQFKNCCMIRPELRIDGPGRFFVRIDGRSYGQTLLLKRRCGSSDLQVHRIGAAGRHQRQLEIAQCKIPIVRAARAPFGQRLISERFQFHCCHAGQRHRRGKRERIELRIFAAHQERSILLLLEGRIAF